jgi:small-conductance mechanosensitive channel
VLLPLREAVIAALAVSVVLRLLARGPARRRPWVADMSRRGRTPLRLALVLIAVDIVLSHHWAGLGHYGSWVSSTAHWVGLALIGVLAWLIAVLAFVIEDLLLARYRLDVEDNRRARRVRTQVSILRRLTVVIVAVVALASMLLTFPTAKAAGASLFASAGLLSVVAGLAAQTSLANVFAGLQLAFTDALRVDDVVVVFTEWGRVEEITLTYVVVHIWDDRRLVLPSTYFTTTPFENWTRRNSDLLGSVDFDLDWTTPFDEMREELRRILSETDLWDGRVGILQVTDAVGSFVHVRVLISGRDGPTVFDLRCHVRESLVRWLQREHPHALPAVRHGEASAAPSAPPRRRPAQRGGETDEWPAETTMESRLFTTAEGARRFRAFAGQGDDPEDDRTRVAVAELASLDGVYDEDPPR